MRKSIFWTKTTIGILTFILLQSCYVQKNSETHASVIYETAPEEEYTATYSNDMVTVEKNHESVASLEALSASILLIDVQKRRINPRWEDDLRYGNPLKKSKNLYAEQIEREEIEPGIINSY